MRLRAHRTRDRSPGLARVFEDARAAPYHVECTAKLRAQSCLCGTQLPNAMRSMATMPATANPKQLKRTMTTAGSFAAEWT